MIIIKSKKCKLEKLKKDYPGAIIHDVTSHATDEFIKFSPFYPHGGIPVPFTPNMTAMSVESIWQGLKDYDLFVLGWLIYYSEKLSIPAAVRQMSRGTAS